jgi:hypothetical protein
MTYGLHGVAIFMLAFHRVAQDSRLLIKRAKIYASMFFLFGLVSLHELASLAVLRSPNFFLFYHMAQVALQHASRTAGLICVGAGLCVRLVLCSAATWAFTMLSMGPPRPGDICRCGS